MSVLLTHLCQITLTSCSRKLTLTRTPEAIRLTRRDPDPNRHTYISTEGRIYELGVLSGGCLDRHFDFRIFTYLLTGSEFKNGVSGSITSSSYCYGVKA